MLPKINNRLSVLLVLAVVMGSVMTGNLGNNAQAADNFPLGRTPAAIVDGQYPASYFPNTELLGTDEMRITALGTGMPNQTRAAVSISYLVELGNGDKFRSISDRVRWPTCFPCGPISRNSTRCLPAICT